MGKARKFITVNVSLIFIYTAILLFSCRTTSEVDTIYKTSSGAQITAETALAIWNDYLKTHEVSVSDELRVYKAYNKYRVFQHELLDYAISNSSNINTNKFDFAISNVSIALTELLQLLTSLGVKL